MRLLPLSRRSLPRGNIKDSDFIPDRLEFPRREGIIAPLDS